MSHPVDPIRIQGIPPIYPAYRASELGQALEAAVKDLREQGLIKQSQYEMLFKEFDRSMTQHLSKLPEEPVTITGTTKNYQFIYNYYNIFLQPAIIQFPEKSTTIDCLQIVALNAEEKKKQKKE